MLLVETPSGILADRWSRKGVLILASIALAISSLITGFSQTQVIYLISSLLWGAFFALYSGVYDSMVYDTIYEETGNSTLFEKLYGRVGIADSSALVLGSLIGGLAASQFGLRSAYFLTIPSAIISIVALIVFKEPQLHKSEVAAPIIKHVQSTFKAILNNRKIAIVMIVLILLSVITYMLFEFSQLWLLALAVPTVLYGPSNAALLASIGIGGVAAGYFKIYRYPIMIFVLVLMLAGGIGLVLFRTTSLIVASQVVLSTSAIGISVVFKNRMLHDSLPSSVRAGSASAVSTITRIFIIPLALLFGFISYKLDIFNASWILFILVVFVAIFILIEANKNNRTGLNPEQI